MYRLIHNQTTQGPIRIDDIDDGLPNKTAHRLGSTADPKAYKRDGYANDPKQPCYVPFWKPGSTTIPGYIDLRQTQRVELSAGKGKIWGFQQGTSPFITLATFAPGDLTAPAVTAANINVPGPGDLTITGTNMLSIQPEVTSVVITGTGAVTLTQAQILAGTGTVSDTSIVIPAALVPGIAAVTSFVEVQADAQSSGAPVAVA